MNDKQLEILLEAVKKGSVEVPEYGARKRPFFALWHDEYVTFEHRSRGYHAVPYTLAVPTDKGREFIASQRIA